MQQLPNGNFRGILPYYIHSISDHLYIFLRCLQWRKFNFFDLKKDIDDGKVANALKVSVDSI